MHQLKFIFAPMVIAILSAGCSSPAWRANVNDRFSDDQKHRLYAAALAASDSPLDSDIFKRVCRHIEVFDVGGKPNDKYIPFVSAHVDWETHQQTEQFRNEINTPEKARQYIDQRLAE
jgi:hypothetical protein